MKAVCAQQLPTTGTIKSRLGKLKLKNGYPEDATVEKIFDGIDFQIVTYPSWNGALPQHHSISETCLPTSPPLSLKNEV